MADKVKQVAAEEAARLQALTRDAVRSRAYLYPIKVGNLICYIHTCTTFSYHIT
jgi:hypothetical protein